MSLQQQIQTPQQLEILNEFQYTINKDLQNILGIAVEFFAIEKIRGQIDPELYKVQKNRLILQHNLSNTIHFDQQETSKVKNLESQLLGMKNVGKEIFGKAKKELSSSLPNFETSEAFQILDQYEKNNYSQSVFIKQLQIEKTNGKAAFDDKVLQAITQAIQQTDQQYEEARQGKNKLEADQLSSIMEKTINRYENAQSKLSQLYPANRQQNQYLPELRLLLASLYRYLESGPNADKQRFLLEILGLQQEAFQKDKDLYSEQIATIKNRLPSFQQFFRFFANDYVFSPSLSSKENPINYLPAMKNHIQQSEMQILNENYQQSQKILRKMLFQYLLQFYEEPQKKVGLQQMKLFEQVLLYDELKQVLPKLKSTFFKYLIENLQQTHCYRIQKGSHLAQEEEDILFIKQELSLLDS